MSPNLSTTGPQKRALFLLMLTFFISGSLFAQYQSYRVQSDETLDSVAQKFEVSKTAILSLNPDINGLQVAGKVIIIPPKETNAQTPTASTVWFKQYRVKSKETLYSLAKRNNISIEDIKRYNPYLYNEELGVNDLIKIPVFSEGTDNLNASVQTSTFKNLIHVVMPKETKWGIAHKYGMTVKQLDSLNPLALELHPGQVLKVLNPATENVNEDLFYYYQVKPKETFYSLTRRLEISRDSLITLNPILKELGLQAGMELKIPKASGYFSTHKNETKKILNLANHLTNFSTKNVAVMLPFNLQKIEASSVDRRAVLKKDKVLQIALDMYSGIKMAIDSVQKLGISVNAHVFDTETNPQRIEEILSANSFRSTDFIIGPLLSDNIEKVAKNLERKHVAIFSPLTSGNLYSSDNIVQTRPSKLVKQKVLTSYIDSLKAGKNLLILNDEKHEFFTQKFLAHFPSARRVTKEKKTYLQSGDLTRLLDKNRPNWVVLESSDYGDISNTVTYLNAALSNYDIRLFTSDKNYVYDVEVPGQYLSHLNFTYSSIDKSDLGKIHTTFVKMYQDKYGVTPNQYAVRGFDVTFDALLRSAAANDIFQGLEEIEGTTEQVQNRFNYHKKMIGGYYNNAVYLIKFGKDLQLKVLN